MAEIKYGSPPAYERVSSWSIVIGAETRNLEKVGNFIRASSPRSGFSESDCRSIELAVDEIVSNAIIHGYSGDSGGRIIVQVSKLAEGGIIISIEEQGAFFNPLNVEQPDTEPPLSERKIGGLGLFLVQQIMDEIYFEAGAINLKRFHLVKRLGRG